MKPSRPIVLRLALLAVLVAVGLFLAFRTLPRVERYRATEEVCAAADRGDWPAVLEGSEELIADDTAGRRAGQCRCRALLGVGRPDDCVALLEELLASGSDDDWLPDPTLTALVVASRDRAGDPVRAADLAHRGAVEYPSQPLLLNQEVTLRSRIEDETTVLADTERRLGAMDPGDPGTLQLRLDFAARRIARGEWREALDLLGDDPEAFPPDLRESWFYPYTEVLAGLGRPDELAAAIEMWRPYADDPLEVDARHALLRSMNQIEDTKGTTMRMLAEVLKRSKGHDDASYLPAVYKRLIASLMVQGEHEAALALYDHARERFDEFDFIERDDILRSATQSLLGEESLEELTGTIRLSVPAARPGDRLLVSPAVDRPIDTPFVPIAVPASGIVEVERAIGTWPQRWVLRERSGRVAGSGSVWPRPGSTVEVEVERRTAEAAAPPRPAPDRAGARRPGDGRRRVFEVILDCADWRLIEYGLARGELPFFEHAIAGGRRAITDSDPPFTALAVSKLVFPDRRGLRSFPEVLHQLGGEIEGLNFVGRNPLAELEWVLPKDDQLFETLAGEGLASVNLLHSHGTLQVGRNAEVLGPGDRVRKLERYRSSRPLTEDETALVHPPDDLSAHVFEMAADFDVVHDLADEPEIDFVALRVASLDLLTHGRFQEMLKSGQDDGEQLLYRVYRYMDRRLAGLLAELDGDDVLIVMSDHGIRTPMEHDRRAVFVALGEGIAPGRIDGSPPIQHVSGWIADLLGVGVDWPGTGEVDWGAAAP